MTEPASQRQADIYRLKGEELRAASGSINTADARQTLARLADTYDVLARRIEEHLALTSGRR